MSFHLPSMRVWPAIFTYSLLKEMSTFICFLFTVESIKTYMSKFFNYAEKYLKRLSPYIFVSLSSISERSRSIVIISFFFFLFLSFGACLGSFNRLLLFFLWLLFFLFLLFFPEFSLLFLCLFFSFLFFLFFFLIRVVLVEIFFARIHDDFLCFLLVGKEVSIPP